MLAPVYDLHCHTNCSDGALSPAELVQRAVHQGVDYLAITDHDSTDSWSLATQAATNEQHPLELICGVEITCRWQQHEIHLLGLNINPDHSAIQSLLHAQQQLRRDRFQGMLDKLAAAGIDIAAELGTITGMPTRKHIADALLAKGVIKDFADAFKRYVGAGQFAYVKADWCDLATAITAVKAAGGNAVLAHPHAYQLSNKWLRRLLEEAKADGMDGLEVAVGQQPQGQRSALAEFAADYNLYASAGSDFHAPKRWRELGKNLCLPESCVPIWSLWQTSSERESDTITTITN